MNRRWSFYDLASGEFIGRTFSASSTRDLERCTPKGCGAMQGSHDPRSARVDLESGLVIAWTNEKLIAAEDNRALAQAARARISALETSQLRALREERLRPNERDEDGKSARDRLQEIDDKIATLRAALSDGRDTSEP